MMAVSYYLCPQSLRVSSGSRICISNSGYHWDKHRKKILHLVCASTRQPEKDLCLESNVQTLLDSVKWDDKGLAVAIAQNVDTGAILMQGFANRDAVVTAISSQKATFYSREEADELCRTLEENEDKSRTASEMADVLYHTMVLLALKDVKIEDVMQVLRQRFSKSGIEEKKSRISQG
uniref:phosphoribosyl-ATP diphosphatase n=1 Tax=Fagus sylvatica TaxID=28930 RepID=A0A2N9J773_FAGSY